MGSRKTGKEIACKHCGKLKYFSGWYIKSKKEKGHKNYFCSVDCYTQSMKGIYRGGSKILKCVICKTEFRAWNANIKIGKAKTCSKKCSAKSASITLQGRKNPEHSKRMLGRKATEETKRKMSIAKEGYVPVNVFQSGEKHPMYIKDRTKLKTARKQSYDYRYREWMKAVKNRDGWKCKISNSDCSGRLEAHHILAWRSHPELRYEVNNGISLCQYHHPRKHEEEKRLVPTFQELIVNNK